MFYEHAPESRQSDSLSDSDSDDAYGERKRAQVHYVYDAAAERTRERIRRGMVSGVDIMGISPGIEVDPL